LVSPFWDEGHLRKLCSVNEFITCNTDYSCIPMPAEFSCLFQMVPNFACFFPPVTGYSCVNSNWPWTPGLKLFFCLSLPSRWNYKYSKPRFPELPIFLSSLLLTFHICSKYAVFIPTSLLYQLHSSRISNSTSFLLYPAIQAYHFVALPSIISEAFDYYLPLIR
jgi:hypothetical protein